MFEKIIEIVKGIKPKVLAKKDELGSKPLTVSVMGETGVGKSSLINSLFGTNLPVDHVRPATKEIYSIPVKSRDKKHELIFFDLPGAGESEETDEKYLKMYVKQALKSDITLWLIQIDRRDYHSRKYLTRLLGLLTDNQKIQFYNKITFVLTKGDILQEGKWIYDSENQIFAPDSKMKSLLREKMKFYKSEFIEKFITYLNTGVDKPDTCKMRVPREEFLSVQKGKICSNKLLTSEDVNILSEKYPDCKDVFPKIFENQNVVPVSSRYKYNLVKLLTIILDKNDDDMILRIEHFIDQETLDKVGKETAQSIGNITIV